MNFEIKHTAIFSSIFILLFGIVMYSLINLPGSINNACVVGAYINTQNIIYNIFITVMISFILTNSVRFGSNNKINTSLIGMLTWMTTTFCVPCVLPVLSILGFSFSLSFFAYTNAWFKALSLLLLMYGSYESHNLKRSKCALGECEI